MVEIDMTFREEITKRLCYRDGCEKDSFSFETCNKCGTWEVISVDLEERLMKFLEEEAKWQRRH